MIILWPVYDDRARLIEKTTGLNSIGVIEKLGYFVLSRRVGTMDCYERLAVTREKFNRVGRIPEFCKIEAGKFSTTGRR